EKQQGLQSDLSFLAADGGDQNAQGQREEERVRQNQDHPPKLGSRDAAQKQRQTKQWENREQRVKRVQRGDNQFAEDDVVAAQVGQKQEAECAFAFLLAE